MTRRCCLRAVQRLSRLPPPAQALQAELQRLQQDLEATTQQLGVLQAAASAARSNEDSLLLAVERLHEEVVDYGLRASQALEQSAGGGAAAMPLALEV